MKYSDSVVLWTSLTLEIYPNFYARSTSTSNRNQHYHWFEIFTFSTAQKLFVKFVWKKWYISSLNKHSGHLFRRHYWLKRILLVSIFAAALIKWRRYGACCTSVYTIELIRVYFWFFICKFFQQRQKQHLQDMKSEGRRKKICMYIGKVSNCEYFQIERRINAQSYEELDHFSVQICSLLLTRLFVCRKALSFFFCL